MRIILILISLLLSFFLFGCTVSVNPQDLAPSNNYSAADTNSPNGTGGANSVQKISFTATEVAKHSAAGNCWMIINGNVYDLSDYVGHPGGSGYLSYCGTNATQGYDTKGGRGNAHSSYSDMLLANYLIGALGQEVVASDTKTAPNNPNSLVQPPAQRPDRDDEEEWDD